MIKRLTSCFTASTARASTCALNELISCDIFFAWNLSNIVLIASKLSKSIFSAGESGSSLEALVAGAAVRLLSKEGTDIACFGFLGLPGIGVRGTLGGSQNG